MLASVQQNGFATPAVVQLTANGDNVSFLSGPILMQSGVTLLIDPGVTLYASRNANEYYNGANGSPSACGTLAVSSSGCRNWITINSGSSRRAKNISFIGPGTIEGRGAPSSASRMVPARPRIRTTTRGGILRTRPICWA